jgi:hypothetical protein
MKTLDDYLMGACEVQESPTVHKVGGRARGARQHGLLAGTEAEEATFLHELESFERRIRGWKTVPFVGTSLISAGEEQRGYKQMIGLRDYAIKIFKGTPKQAIMGWLITEAQRWQQHRTKSLFGSGEDEKDLGTIKTRLLSGIERAKIIVGAVPAVPVPGVPKEEKPKPEIKKPFEVSPTLLLIGAGVVAAFFMLKKR